MKLLGFLLLSLFALTQAADAKTFCKSAKTGHFVSSHYAVSHPKTTICQTR